jgi:ankyrin repeat protein
MTRLSNFPIFIFILLAIQLMFVGCNKSPDTTEVLIETNKLENVVITEEAKEDLTVVKTNILETDLTNEESKPIHEAAANGDISNVKKYLESGVKLNSDYDIKKTYGGNPLFSAVFNGHNAIIELLISKGADVNSTDINGETPLDWAISRNLIDTDILLRKHGGKTSKELKAKNGN